MSRIYVATSWRNEFHEEVVSALVREGHEIYDFRDEATGSYVFSWSDIDPDWKEWNLDLYKAGLETHQAKKGFCADYGGMNWAEVCVLVLPCGRSAHIEAGWFVGQGKRLWIYNPPGVEMEPELMYKMADGIVGSLGELLQCLQK